ncbi:MAG: phenylalanine--tRNA ligase subunit alpha [Chitinophagales bacterium]|nr:phenylalanine--tRNA ligase subunit alpha [Chitinophagales bacterium]
MDVSIDHKQYLEEINSFEPKSAEELEAFRLKFLGNKGIIKQLFADFKTVPNDQKKDYGQLVNEIKNAAESKLKEFQTKITSAKDSKQSSIDLTAPAYPIRFGSRHPIQIIKNKIIDIFHKIGYVVAEGPEIEDDWHNFTALNTPEDHPARDMQDTFYISDSEMLLRTHTSSVQIREMESQPPPIRIITPGRVYRNETISARAHCTFHQVEGLYIDEDVSFADLKQTLLYFAREMFGLNSQIRLRPSFFPFTEISAELDVSCFICDQKGCPVCKGTGWVEIMGCGMVDPAVLENCNINPDKYSGFAFGMGIERIAMLKYQIDDIRMFFENDIRFLQQFSTADQ